MAGISKEQRRLIQKDLKAMRANYQTVYVLYPTETACTVCGGADTFTDSAYDVSCATCGGAGYTLSWEAWEIRARIKLIDLTQLLASGIPPGIEVGDAELFVSYDSKEALKKVIEESRAYVYFGGQRFRPETITADGVGKQDEWRIELKRHNPEVTPVGY